MKDSTDHFAGFFFNALRYGASRHRGNIPTVIRDVAADVRYIRALVAELYRYR